MKEINWVTLTIALLGAAKIVLSVFGIEIITDDLIDSTANAVAAVVAVVGVVMSHSKPTVKEVKQVDEFRAPIEPSA